jgi:hypothetical protein
MVILSAPMATPSTLQCNILHITDRCADHGTKQPLPDIAIKSYAFGIKKKAVLAHDLLYSQQATTFHYLQNVPAQGV